jgi:hypothetical protein
MQTLRNTHQNQTLPIHIPDRYSATKYQEILRSASLRETALRSHKPELLKNAYGRGIMFYTATKIVTSQMEPNRMVDGGIGLRNIGGDVCEVLLAGLGVGGCLL